jgi:RNA polymerase sigma-70 factor (ECF subfamily)
MKYCKDYDAAQDMLHDGFIKVFTQIKKYSGSGSFEGWMHRVFVNTILAHFRKEKNNYLITSDIDEADMEIEDENFERLFNDDITEAILLSMIQEMPVGYRTVFSLYIFEDMSHREISKKLGIKENASRSQYSRAKSYLKNKITEYLANNNG